MDIIRKIRWKFLKPGQVIVNMNEATLSLLIECFGRYLCILSMNKGGTVN